ncbi:hypothetical protein SAMN04489729_0896 [Amycolatopsis lurida]|uniref:Uncharacterized protein n=1 Tax=Amycolatopsis lurida NRRL 2430 TaxID=1460371 RepID=A0A2P2FLW3_AMYLU|nr:hypothetical protein [Amycolatopsis lurida]KFU77716.1 hypothetical protein BB31_29040 [Amycolatopsis lurida NRRL 2430]SEB39930.1 hypothetical protein SAMN04489729_0896 [Amycolatopsis lurida]
MSGFGKWNLGIGAVLMSAAVLCSVLDLIPAAVITGILGLLGLGIAGYDLIDGWAERADLRRREARVLREREERQGR